MQADNGGLLKAHFAATRYLPVTETWHTKVMSKEKNENGNLLQLRDEFDEPIYRYHCEIDEPRLSNTEFWKKRGVLTSFSDLQEDFYIKISSRYGAERRTGTFYRMV